MNKYQLFTKKKNEAEKFVAQTWAKNLVEAKMNFEERGFSGAYMLGSSNLPSLFPVVLRKL
jgi:hypothetical protein